MADFSGKAVIVTGSSRGIGREVALAFGREGAFLTVHGQSKEKLDETLELLRLSGVEGRRIVVVLGPIQDEKIAKSLVDETVKKFGRIDVLVNNAGTAKLEGEDLNTLKNYDHVFDVNVRSVIQLTNLAVPHLAKTKGNIINVSSIGSMHTSPTYVHYVMSKAALDHYSRNVANTLGEQGIRVNVINPGFTKSDFRSRIGLDEDKIQEAVTGKIILGRFGEASEIAEVILFVASSKASYITGTTIVVDGGFQYFANSCPICPILIKKYPRWDSLRNDEKCPCETCDCGRCEYCNLPNKKYRRNKRYTSNNNCAHYLSNYLIVERGLTAVKNAAIVKTFEDTGEDYYISWKTAECCPMGRPICAKEMASVDVLHGVFEYVLGMDKNKVSPGENCFMYSEGGVGHVYYGTKAYCAAGTGSGEDFGMKYFQYYYKSIPEVSLQKIRYYEKQEHRHQDGVIFVKKLLPESEIQRR